MNDLEACVSQSPLVSQWMLTNGQPHVRLVEDEVIWLSEASKMRGRTEALFSSSCLCFVLLVCLFLVLFLLLLFITEASFPITVLKVLLCQETSPQLCGSLSAET